MMFSFWPPKICPTVTTAGSSTGDTSRETIVCSRMTTAAAITIGSMDASGRRTMRAPAAHHDRDLVRCSECRTRCKPDETRR